MKKKIAKIIGVMFLLVVGTLIAAPYFLEAKISEIIKNNVNDNLNGTLDFADASLSLISSFPNAEVSLEGVSLINEAPFENDTLFAAQQIDLKMSVSQLFNSEDKPIAIERVFVDEATINITINKEGNASYDIGKATDSEDELEEPSSDESSGFQLNLESYEIQNSKISYNDKSTGMAFEFADFNHSGTGDLSLEKSELDTHTDGLVSFEMDSTNYFKKNPIKLDALLAVDLKENKYSFLKNKAVLNQLAIVFDGFVKLNDDNQEVSINFNTLSTDFKNFLALVPESYSKDIENVKTSGDFVLEGHFNGIVDDLHIPKFEIKINSDNAFFKYPDLPKSVKNVFIDVDIVNTTGIVEDTFVDIDKLSFMIDEDTFNMMAKIKELTGNTKVNAHVDCKMNLANIEKAYPVPAGLDLKGIFNADITTAFDMASIENEQYENTQTRGSMSLADFVYNSSDMANPVKLKTTDLTFNPKTVTLNKMIGSSGTTDFNATGTINNFLGYMFNDEKVEGNFDLKSDTFALSDFMTADEEVAAGGESGSEDEQSAPEEKIKIPSFLDVNINATANKVLYDDLVLKDVKGKLRINDEKAILSNMTTSIFDGKMAFNGEVSTKNETPTFAMKLDMNQLEIGETFKSLELFKAIAPIAEILKGKLDSDIELSGDLTDDFMPDLLSLSGDMLANIFPREVDASSTPMLSALAGKLDFVDLKKLNLKDLKTKLSFKDGLVSVKPFTVKYQDIDIVIDGSHTFDKKMNYKASMNVPAKYLGDQLSGLAGNLDEEQLENLTVPVIANIGGNYASPKVTTDITSGIKSLTSQLIEIQKQKLTNQGKDKAKDLLNGLLGGGSESDKESNEKSDSTKESVSGALGGLLGGSKKEDDTTSKSDAVPAKKEDDAVKDAAKDILGGLFGKKKKKKDSVN